MDLDIVKKARVVDDVSWKAKMLPLLVKIVCFLLL